MEITFVWSHATSERFLNRSRDLTQFYESLAITFNLTIRKTISQIPKKCQTTKTGFWLNSMTFNLTSNNERKIRRPNALLLKKRFAAFNLWLINKKFRFSKLIFCVNLSRKGVKLKGRSEDWGKKRISSKFSLVAGAFLVKILSRISFEREKKKRSI